MELQLRILLPKFADGTALPACKKLEAEDISAAVFVLPQGFVFQSETQKACG